MVSVDFRIYYIISYIYIYTYRNFKKIKELSLYYKIVSWRVKVLHSSDTVNNWIKNINKS